MLIRHLLLTFKRPSTFYPRSSNHWCSTQSHPTLRLWDVLGNKAPVFASLQYLAQLLTQSRPWVTTIAKIIYWGRNRKLQAFLPDRKLIGGRDSLLGIEIVTLGGFLLPIKSSEVATISSCQVGLTSMGYLHGSKANWPEFWRHQCPC